MWGFEVGLGRGGRAHAAFRLHLPLLSPLPPSQICCRRIDFDSCPRTGYLTNNHLAAETSSAENGISNVLVNIALLVRIAWILVNGLGQLLPIQKVYKILVCMHTQNEILIYFPQNGGEFNFHVADLASFTHFHHFKHPSLPPGVIEIQPIRQNCKNKLQASTVACGSFLWFSRLRRIFQPVLCDQKNCFTI